MMWEGIIWPSSSPRAAAIVMVKKKDGNHRVYVDYRQLNNSTIEDTQPLPCIDDMLEALHKSRFFFTLHLRARYWQITVPEEDKLKTAFRTNSSQLMKCEVMPLRLCNAPITFSWLMNANLSGLYWEVCLV